MSTHTHAFQVAARGALICTLCVVALGAILALAGDVVQPTPGDGFVVKDNTGTIERLRLHEATGEVSRNRGLFSHPTGTSKNTYVGPGAWNAPRWPLAVPRRPR